MKLEDPFANLAIPPGEVKVIQSRGVRKRQTKRRRQFAIFPMAWYERMSGAAGRTYHVAIWLLHENFRRGGHPIKVANGRLGLDGTSSPQPLSA
jgi:hypothetical protein